MFESSLEATKAAMKAKIPEIEKTTALVEYFMKKREEGSTVTTRYSLADTVRYLQFEIIPDNAQRRPNVLFITVTQVYGTAELEKDGMMCMWLGANVMVEYTCEDAIQLLTKSKTSAESRLRETEVRNWLFFHKSQLAADCVPHSLYSFVYQAEIDLVKNNIITTEVRENNTSRKQMISSFVSNQ